MITGSKRDALNSLPATVVPGLASLAGLVSIGHLAGERTLGLVSLAWVTANFGSSITAMGPAHAALRAVSSGDGAVGGYRGVLMRRCAAASLVALAAGTALLAAGSGLGGPIALAAPLITAQAVVLFEGEVLRAERRFAAASGLLSARSTLSWVASVAGAVHSSSLVWIMVPHLAVSAGVAIAVLITRPPSRPTPPVRRDAREIGSPIARMSLASHALGYMDRYIVHAALGPAAVGVYTIGYTLGQGAIEVVTTPMTTALLPRIVSEWLTGPSGPDTAVRTARRGAVFALLVTGFVVPVVLLAGAVGLLDPFHRHGSLGPVAAVVAGATGIHAVTRTCYALLLGAGRSDDAMVAFWRALLVAALATPLLTAAWGIVGTALATALTYAYLAAAMTRAVRQTREHERPVTADALRSSEAGRTRPARTPHP